MKESENEEESGETKKMKINEIMKKAKMAKKEKAYGEENDGENNMAAMKMKI